MPLRLNGSTSGYIEIAAPAVADNSSIDLVGALAAKANYPAGGSDGQALTKSGTDTAWVDLAGMTQIASVTLSGSAVTINSIPATYRHLNLIVRNYRPVNDDAGLNLRFNSDANANRYLTHSLLGGGAYSFNATAITLIDGSDNTVAYGLSSVTVFDYANTSTWKTCAITGGANAANDPSQLRTFNAFGYYNQTGAISSITLLTTSGNFNAGTAILYGVK